MLHEPQIPYVQVLHICVNTNVLLYIYTLEGSFFFMLYIPVSAVVPVFVWIDPDEGVGEFFFFSSKFAFKNEYL